MEHKTISINIDFDKISNQLDKVIETANQRTLESNPHADLSELERIVMVSKQVCLTMLQDYHNELMNSLSASSRTTAEQVLSE
jgi:hypothetical protein